MKSVTMVSFVFTLSFCFSLVAGKALKGTNTNHYLVEVDDNEDNNADTVKNASNNADGDDYKFEADFIGRSSVFNDEDADMKVKTILDSHVVNKKLPPGYGYGHHGYGYGKK